MKTGTLKRIWSRGKSFYEDNEKIIKAIIVVISIIIAIILAIWAVNPKHGGFKNYYAYNEEAYIDLENLLKETIVNDPYMDLKNLDTTVIKYTCDYDSEQNNWKIKISKGTVQVVADISCIENGTLEVETSYEQRWEYWVLRTVAIIFVVTIISIIVYYAIWIILLVLIGLFMVGCLFEKLVIAIKRKKINCKK